MDIRIPYGKQYIDQDDIEAVTAVLRSSFLTQGPMVEEFESRIADYCGVRNAVAFNSGTSALHAAMFAAGAGPGDEVITSPLTFVATANSAVYLGAKPVFVDIDPVTWCIDADKIARAVNDKTKVIIPVDYAGFPVDIQAISTLAHRQDIVVIEDAAHALGARRHGIPVGREADMTMFSFHPVKHITTGEGGVIVTERDDFALKLKLFRSHGIVKTAEMTEEHGPWYYEMQELGHNYRITDIQCALGISQLSKLEKFIEARQRIASRYFEAFHHTGLLRLPPQSGNRRHAYHLFPILLPLHVNRREFVHYMHEAGIGVQIHYIPVHLQPYYREKYGFKAGDFPLAEEFYKHEVSLPMYYGLTEAEQDYVIQKVRHFIETESLDGE